MNHYFTDVSRRVVLSGIAVGSISGIVESKGLFGGSVKGTRWPSMVVTPEDFGAPASGSGDAAPAINSAIRHLHKNGGGVIRLAAGKVYRLASVAPGTDVTTSSFQASIGLPGGARDILIDLNGASLFQATDALTIGPAYPLFNDPHVRNRAQPLARPSKRGETNVQLLSPPRNIAPNDLVMLVAGNTLLSKAGYAPVAELLKVSDISGNRVNFTEALCKDYFPNPDFPYGLMNVNDCSISNCAIIGPGCIVNQFRRSGNIMQAFNFELSRVECRGRGGFAVRGRHIQVADIRAELRPDWSPPVFRPYALAIDTGSSHVTVRDLYATAGDNVAILHLHEGLADVIVDNVMIQNGTITALQGEWFASISILAGSWNLFISNVIVVNNPQGRGLEVRAAVEGGLNHKALRFENLRFEGRFRGVPLSITNSVPCEIDGLDLRRVQGLHADRMIQILAARPKIARLQARGE